MNNKLKHKNSTPDTLDMRINQLIVKYSKVCESDSELESDLNSKSDINYDTDGLNINRFASFTVARRKSGSDYAYPVNNDYCFYKARDSSDADYCKENEDRILISCHDNCSSSDSNAADNDSAVTSQKWLKEDYAISKPRVKFRDDYQQTLFNNFPDKSYAEKTTYCRPVKSPYDICFVDKVMERNAKLQMLLIKHLINRQKEKEKEKWNKESSKYFSSPFVSRKSDNQTKKRQEHDQKSYLRESDSYQEMLQEVYDTPVELYSGILPKYERKSNYNENLPSRVYENNEHFLPSVSEDRRNYEKPENIDQSHRSHKTRPEPKILMNEKNFFSKTHSNTIQHFQQIHSNSLYHSSVIDMKQTRDVQTHITLGGYNTGKCLTNELEPEIQTMNNEIHTMTKDMNEVKNIVTEKDNHGAVRRPVNTIEKVTNINKPTIQDLEVKLDIVINLFNSFASEFRSKKLVDEIKYNENFVNVDKNTHTTDIETIKSCKTNNVENIVGNVMTNTSFCASKSNLTPSNYLMNMRLDKILHEELDKSNKIRSEIANMLNTRNRSAVKLYVEIPTKERSTEVTASLAKTKLESRSESELVEHVSYREIPQRTDRRIAVNTEPLGLLTLLRLSTEAVKQILSCLPDLSWYLTRAATPALTSTDYVCNICGAAFTRPSQLGVHILRHDLGQARDCSVCRHTVDRRRPSQLFRCRHCGQLFTRAYCCELHQRGCQAGGLRSSAPSRALLR